jgi:putative transposase
VPSYVELCAEFKCHAAYRALPARIGQEVIKKARRAWNAYFACRRLHRAGKIKRQPRIPGYWKDRRTGQRQAKLIPIQAPTAYSLDNRCLALRLPADMRKRPGDSLVVRTRGVLRFHGTPKTVELIYDPIRRRWYAHQAVEMDEPKRPIRPSKAAAVDLGARSLVALAVDGINRPLLFSGREVWKDFRYWTKRIAKEQSRLAQAGRKTSRTLRRLYQIRARRLKHAFVALAACIARVLRRYKVTILYIEDLMGIRDSMDFGSGNLLVHNFWAFGMLRRLIEAACNRRSIEVQALQPRGTSSTCAVCGAQVQRPVRHKVACKHCSRVWHADANAAYNLLIRGSSKGHGAEAMPQKPLAFRWNHHRWLSRFKSATSFAA